MAVVQAALTALLPADFSGPANIERHDGYVDISLKAGELKRGADGRWGWPWIHYTRKTHIPWFSGMTWQSQVDIAFGVEPSK